MVKPNSLSKKPKTDRPKPAGPAVAGRAQAAKPRPVTGKSAVKAAKPGGAGAESAIPESGETEKRILAAARKVFVAKGLDGARMQAVATEAGVNKALLHYYYRSKEKLYQKVLQDTIGTIWGRLVSEFRVQDTRAGLEPLLRTVVGTYVRTLAANPDFPLFMFREMASGGAAFREGIPELLKRFQDVPATITRVLAEEVKAGKVKPIPPIHFFMNLMGMTVLTFLIRPMLLKLGPDFGVKFDFGPAFLEERIESITDTLLNGIRIKR